jgi:hypothetical protein
VIFGGRFWTIVLVAALSAGVIYVITQSRSRGVNSAGTLSGGSKGAALPENFTSNGPTYGFANAQFSRAHRLRCCFA